MDQKQITVTSPLLPDLDEFHDLLKEIWDSKWITNNGHFHQQLEKALCEYFGVEYLSLFTNRSGYYSTDHSDYASVLLWETV